MFFISFLLYIFQVEYWSLYSALPCIGISCSAWCDHVFLSGVFFTVKIYLCCISSLDTSISVLQVPDFSTQALCFHSLLLFSFHFRRGKKKTNKNFPNGIGHLLAEDWAPIVGQTLGQKEVTKKGERWPGWEPPCQGKSFSAELAGVL